ncbi:MAG: thioredoxin family protein [Prevotella sp.]
MKRLIVTLTAALLTMGCLQTKAQNDVQQTSEAANEGIKFEEGTFAQALAKAKEQKKMLFIDCYTSWCGPCKMLSSKVFPQKKVGDYFNKEFVSLKVDMEKGEGVDLKNKFGVKAFPTLLFIDANGKEINRIVGAESDVDKFLKNVKDGLGSNSLSAMTERYDGGERDTSFLIAYLGVLDRAYNKTKSAEVAELLLKGNESDMLTNEGLYKAFIKYNKSPLTPSFQYMLANKAAFEAKYDKDKLNQTATFVWKSYPYSFIKKNTDGSSTFDAEGMNAYKAEMKKWNVKEADEIATNIEIAWAEAQGNWKQYAEFCSKYIKKYGEDDMLIYNWAGRICKNCKDAAVRKKAVSWIKKRQANIAKEKAKEKPLPPGVMKAMPMVNFDTAYEKLLKELESN